MDVSSTPDVSRRVEVAAALIEKVAAWYVFPDVADRVRHDIAGRLGKGDYDLPNTPETFCKALTADLRQITGDKHLFVWFRAEEALDPSGSPEQARPPDQTRRREDDAERSRQRNFSFHRTECLRGNIGYLDIRGFEPPRIAGATAVAAMNFLANTNALIVDLRRNGGGDPAMVALISSYFFEGDPVHLNSLYWRASDSTHQYWTLPYVPGPRYGKKPVYLLIGPQTFSAAEEFAYNLKNSPACHARRGDNGRRRKSGGRTSTRTRVRSLHPQREGHQPDHRDELGRCRHLPDVPVPADQALGAAHRTALRALLAASDEATPGPLRATVEEALRELTQMKPIDQPEPSAA